MKISSVSTFRVPAIDIAAGVRVKSFLFVRLETDGGVVGWGEAFLCDGHEERVNQKTLALGRNLKEMSEVDPHSFRDRISGAGSPDPSDLDASSAGSAIEIALWDLQGKILQRPVYDLLSATPRKSIQLYANTWQGETMAVPELLALCAKHVADGYRAVKIYPLKYGGAVAAGECMKAVRQALGDDIEVLLDLSAGDDANLAIETARAVAPFNPYWFEEPVGGDNLQGLVAIRRETKLRVVTGEKQQGTAHFRAVLESNAADILNPDIAAIGGILDMLEIGAMAEKHRVAVSQHCWNSMTVALAAMLHVCAVMGNADKAEIFPHFFLRSETFSQADFVIREGRATLGDAPGLGVNIDTAALARVAQRHNA